MPRLHLNGGEIKDIPEQQPILITGWLISAGSTDAILTGSDADGDIFPVNGMTVGAYEYGGANLKIPANPTVTCQLVGTGCAATIYYETGKYVFEIPY